MTISKHTTDTLTPSAVIDGDTGVRLACYADGPEDAPTIILIHGYPDSAHVWDAVVADLASEYRCIRYDVRGAGRSERPSRTRDYAMPRLRADLAAVLDWACPDTPAHLVAHDWGSIQTWESVTEPDMRPRIASFTSISGPCLDHAGHGARDQWRRDRRALTSQLKKSWYIAAFHVPLLPQLAWRTVLGKRWPDTLARSEGTAIPTNPTLVEDGIHGIKLYRANMLKYLMAPRERYAQAPVQIIVPEHDPFVGPGFVQGLERWVSDLHIEYIKAGHWVIQSHAAEVARHIRHFVARQRPQPPADQTAAGSRAPRRSKRVG